MSSIEGFLSIISQSAASPYMAIVKVSNVARTPRLSTEPADGYKKSTGIVI